MKKINLSGKRFGRLLVVGFSHRDKGGRAHWAVRCVCGGQKVVEGNRLKTSTTRSCGCIKEKHGKTGTPTFVSWTTMKQRCYNKNTKAYKHYGGRGIAVCDRWLESFNHFLLDMGERPKGLTLERINNGKGYSKENCKWATYEDQNNNRRDNILIDYNGISLTLPQWSKKLGINKSTLYNRLNVYCWPIQKAFVPIQGGSL